MLKPRNIWLVMKLVIAGFVRALIQPREIWLITLLVIVGFVMSDVIVQSLMIYSPLQRFGVRLGLMGQFLAVIYLVFESRDTARRLRRMEMLLPAGGDDPDDTNDSTMEKEKRRNE